eukprot:1993398-Pleurochrysis_carterae.AAC.1
MAKDAVELVPVEDWIGSCVGKYDAVSVAAAGAKVAKLARVCASLAVGAAASSHSPSGTSTKKTDPVGTLGK